MPNTTTIKVTGCHDCPFLYDATYCTYPGDGSSLDVCNGNDQECAPKACPLRVAAITIAYTGDGREPMDPP